MPELELCKVGSKLHKRGRVCHAYVGQADSKLSVEGRRHKQFRIFSCFSAKLHILPFFVSLNSDFLTKLSPHPYAGCWSWICIIQVQWHQVEQPWSLMKRRHDFHEKSVQYRPKILWIPFLSSRLYKCLVGLTRSNRFCAVSTDKHCRLHPHPRHSPRCLQARTLHHPLKTRRHFV
jgi:hypothetical protein